MEESGIMHLTEQYVIKGDDPRFAVIDAAWKAGRIAGWMEAPMENSPQTFKSLVAAEQITALQAM
jgi:hypothetical protein